MVGVERQLAKLLGKKVELVDNTTLKSCFKSYIEKDAITL